MSMGAQPHGNFVQSKGEIDAPHVPGVPRLSFSEVIEPLTKELRANEVVPFSDRRSAYDGTYPAEVRQIIESYFEQFDISRLKIEVSDAVWLLSDPWGNMLWRPILGAMLLDSIKAIEAQNDAQQSIKNAISKVFREDQFKSFDLGQEVVPPRTKVTFDTASVGESKKSFFLNSPTTQVRAESSEYSDTAFADKILTHAFVCLAEIRELRNELGRMIDAGRFTDVKNWLSDPGYGFSLAYRPQELRCLGGKYTGPLLSQPLRFLHVEDDYSRFWSDLFSRDSGFVPIRNYTYSPDKPEEYDDQVPSVSRVREILPILQKKRALPEVCLIDLELSDGFGVDIVEEIHAASVPAPLIYLYSANLAGFREQVDTLIASGKVIAAYDKMYFDLATFITSVNQQLAQQNLPGG